MRIFEAIIFGQNSLKNIKRNRVEVEKFIMKIIKKDRLFLILNQNYTLSENEISKYKEFIFRRKNREPLEYILNMVSFYSEEFFIKGGALIPRPETELLINKALDILSKLKSPKVLEIGIGSGVISTILAKNIDNILIVAVDISLEALDIAKTNIQAFEVMDKIELRESDLFENIRKDEHFDLIISNPPYISDNENGRLQKELDYEPNIALYGGDIGDEILKKIIKFFFLSKTKYLLCEMGYDQKEKITNFVENKAILEFYKDLSELDRGFILTKFNWD